MKALVKYAAGSGNMEIREVPEPEPGPGQVKIAVEKTGICGSDLHILHSDIAIPVRPPVVTGHEFAGLICAVGRDVQGWKVGDRVVSETAFTFCGTCSACRAGFYNLCPERRTLGYWYDGAFAPFVVVPAARLHRLPEAISLEEAALTEPLACVTHALFDLTSITPADLVLVSGPGAVGLTALQVARAAGARVVVAGTKGDADRLKAARELGAFRVVAVDEEPLPKVVQELSNGSGVDIVLECSGSRAAVDAGLQALRRRGQFTQIGLFGAPISVNFELVCYRELRVTGSLGSRFGSWEKALALMASGAVRTRPLISDIMPLGNWAAAFEKFEKKQGLKLLLDPKVV
ncbi:MAG: zinc-binding dehydrogenase [Spirochaetia bacterium]|jgi:L-iditol 2-dehydrogenase